MGKQLHVEWGENSPAPQSSLRRVAASPETAVISSMGSIASVFCRAHSNAHHAVFVSGILEPACSSKPSHPPRKVKRPAGLQTVGTCVD